MGRPSAAHPKLPELRAELVPHRPEELPDGVALLHLRTHARTRGRNGRIHGFGITWALIWMC